MDALEQYYPKVKPSTSSGWGNDLKMNTLQYHISLQDIDSHVRQDENTIQNKPMQNFRRLTSRANYS